MAFTMDTGKCLVHPTCTVCLLFVWQNFRRHMFCRAIKTVQWEPQVYQCPYTNPQHYICGQMRWLLIPDITECGQKKIVFEIFWENFDIAVKNGISKNWKFFERSFAPGILNEKILSLMTQFGGKRHHSLTSFKIQCKSTHKVNIVVLHLPTFEGLFVTVWPDLPKFHHFGKMLKIFGNFFRVTLVFGKNLEPT